MKLSYLSSKKYFLIYITFIWLFFTKINSKSLNFLEDQNDIENKNQINKSKWMEENLNIIGSKTLAQITIPGTHDSGSYNVTKGLINNPDWITEFMYILDKLNIRFFWKIIDGWAKSQSQNIYTQLNAGFRYLDIRFCYSAIETETRQFWRIDHGAVVGEKIIEVLNQVQIFMEENTNEVLVIELAHSNTQEAHERENINEFNKMIEDSIGKYLLDNVNYSNNHLNLPTLNEMIKMNKRIILTLNDDAFRTGPEYYKKYWAENFIQNSYADVHELNKMITYNNKKVEEFNSRTNNGRLFKISWTLTPDTEAVLEGLFTIKKPRNLLQLANVANQNFNNWYVQTRVVHPDYVYPIFGNIFIIDNYETCNFVDSLLEDLYRS